MSEVHCTHKGIRKQVLKLMDKRLCGGVCQMVIPDCSCMDQWNKIQELLEATLWQQTATKFKRTF